MSTETSLKKANAAENQGPLVIVRELIKAGQTGTVAEGVLEKTEPSKFNPAAKDYFIRGADNTLYIVNETSALKEQLDDPTLIGKNIRVVYNGKVTTKTGKGYHDYECFVK
jgi:hypothetical protein